MATIRSREISAALVLQANIVHSKAGLALRYHCNYIMKKQGHEEPTGKAKITPTYNLPCAYVIHTVGPIVQGRLTQQHEELLASCYEFCNRYVGKHMLYLELGVGMNTPVIIKFPFWKAVERNIKAFYACINYGESGCDKKIAKRSLCMDADIVKVLRDLI
ncbi:MAG: macro domain-containing protein [Oribacterium sp.]|nr:macro domain-containing protein [Oribacterium sp.]